MKLLITILLITLSHGSFAKKSYRATEIFSEVEVLSLVESYYELHDQREDVDKYLELLVEKDLYMLMGSEVTSKKEFKKWLKKMRIFSKKVNHKVVDINITKDEDGSYFVDSCINYKGKLRFGIKFNKTDSIKWKLVESSDEEKLLIKSYIVKSSCK